MVQKLVFLTTEEMAALELVARRLLESEGKLKYLGELTISDQFKSDLQSAVDKLDKAAE